MDTYKLDEFNVEKINSMLSRFGIAQVDNYIVGHELNNLLVEFDNLQALVQQDEFEFPHQVDEICCANIRLEKKIVNTNNFPHSSALFFSEAFENLSKRYFKTSSVSFNEELFYCKHNESDQRINSLPYIFHFDKMHTLKYFLYLNDVGEENGPLEVVLRSHKQNCRLRKKYLRNLQDLDNVVDPSICAENTPLYALAGTLFVFDTDISHRAGHVMNGSYRKVIRGHTRLSSGSKPGNFLSRINNYFTN